MTSFHVNDVRSIFIAIVKFEFINAKELSFTFRLDQLSSIYGIKLLKTLFIDIFDSILAKTCEFSYFLIGIIPCCQKVTCILIQFFCNTMSWSFEGNKLHFGFATLRTYILIAIKLYLTEITPKWKMSQGNPRMIIDMHLGATLAGNIIFSGI